MSVVRTAVPAGGLRRMFRRPEGVAEGTRWLFTWLALASLAFCLPGVLSTARGGMLLLGLAATFILAASWVYGFLNERVPFALDVIDALAMTAFALAGPAPAAIVSVTFACVWLRTLYGSTWRSLARCSLYAAALVGTLLLWPFIPGHLFTPPLESLVGMISTMFLTVIIASQLGMGLLARDRAIRRDKAMATTGSELLGLTDAAEIRGLAWTASTEICAATPGLRLLKAVRDGSVLRVEGVTGAFQAVPRTLPGGCVSAHASPAVASILDPAPLDAAVGAPMMWDCVRLTEQKEDAWLVVGAPKKIPPAAMLSVRSLVNQVALALRNSDVHQQLTAQATNDSLTGLDNRASFTAKLSSSLAHRARPEGLHVLFLDLDDFKDVNDVLGHRGGDAVLVEVAARLRECTRPDDVCARLGGDEFALVLNGTTEATAAAIARRMVDSFAVPISVGDRTVRVGGSVGIATATPGIDIEELVHQADVAMYAAKANGKGRTQVFDSGLLHVDESHVSFERRLEVAATAGELVVYYQPIVSLPDLRCTGVEALVRWQHPERGLLQPGDFIETAERTGAIIGIGAFVVRQACTDAVMWQNAHPDTPLTVHVNVSARELETDQYIDTVMECLADVGMPAAQLVLELTETVVLDSPAAIGRLKTLAAHGVGIAIDDFGTGYSSLTTLRSLPVNVVKLDTSFVAGALTNPVDRTVIDAIVHMSTQLGIHTVAEGVERLEQQHLLERIGTDSAQGYLYARPVPAAELTAWLRENLTEAAAHDAEVITLRPRNSA